MNDLRIWALVKNKNEKSVSAVFSDSIIECLYPGVLKMINKINEFKNFNFLFSKKEIQQAQKKLEQRIKPLIEDARSKLLEQYANPVIRKRAFA
mgnify:CR=1 FL=1